MKQCISSIVKYFIQNKDIKLMIKQDGTNLHPAFFFSKMFLYRRYDIMIKTNSIWGIHI